MMVAAKGGQRVGYIRVSSVDQNEARQQEALNDLQIDVTFTEKASGKDTKRPELQAALKHLRKGDVLVVYEIARLARSMRDLQNLVAELNGRGIGVEFVKERLAFTGDDSPMNRLMFNMMASFAEFERAVILERQKEGIAIAKANGVYKGRPKKLSDEQSAQIRQRIAAGEPKADLAREFGISRFTVYQYLKGATPRSSAHTSRC